MTDDQIPGSRTGNDQSPEEQAEEPTPRERIAAARQLYAVMKDYLDRPNWTPMEGTLIVSGIHPPVDCAEIPNGGVGLDGRVFTGGGNERFSDARRIWRKWTWGCEDDQENGEDTPVELKPHEFLIWCDDMDIETDWIRLCRALYGHKTNAGQADFIPAEIVEYATLSARAIDALTARLAAHDADAAAQTGSGKSLARSPMPLPQHREHKTAAPGKRSALAKEIARAQEQARREGHSDSDFDTIVALLSKAVGQPQELRLIRVDRDGIWYRESGEDRCYKYSSLRKYLDPNKEKKRLAARKRATARKAGGVD